MAATIENKNDWDNTLRTATPYSHCSPLVKINSICSFIHCVKSVQIRCFFWSVFSHLRTEYGVMPVFFFTFTIQGRKRWVGEEVNKIFGSPSAIYWVSLSHS